MTSHEPRCSGVKHCPACDKDKPVLAFATDRHATDGLFYICRECQCAYSKRKRAKELSDNAMKRYSLMGLDRIGD